MRLYQNPDGTNVSARMNNWPPMNTICKVCGKVFGGHACGVKYVECGVEEPPMPKKWNMGGDNGTIKQGSERS